MSKEKPCPFCKSVELRKWIERVNKDQEQEQKNEIVLAVALVEHTVINGETCGRVTDYMEHGEGYPLRFCPTCGKRLGGRRWRPKEG